MDSRSKVFEFIASKHLMTISSVNGEGLPQAAVVGFALDEDFTLVFRTSNQSRKFRNIAGNEHVAAVIGWDGPETVQFEGVAKEATGANGKRLVELFLTKNPKARQFLDLPDERFLVVTPTWVRYTNLSSTPWDITEFKF